MTDIERQVGEPVSRGVLSPKKKPISPSQPEQTTMFFPDTQKPKELEIIGTDPNQLPLASSGGNRVVSAFPFLGEDGLFSVISGSFSPNSFEPLDWINSIGRERRRELKENRTDFEITMSQIYQVLGVNTGEEIPKVLVLDSFRRENARKIANRLTLGQYGLDKNDRGEDRSDAELETIISDIANDADRYMEYQANRPWFKNHPLQLSQDVVDANNPADLLCIVLDKSYSRKTRFQAKFKLEIMDSIAASRQGDLQNKLRKQHARFMGFVGRHVLKGLIGEVEEAFLVADHRESDFSVAEVGFFTAEEKEQADEYLAGRFLGTMTRITPRTFATEDGTEIPVYFDTRIKSLNSQIEKKFRKADANKDRAITDYLGSMVVLPNRAAINEFKLALVRRGIKAGILVKIRTEEDTLDGGNYSAKNIGSSSKLRQYKMVVQLMGITIELIAYTYETYINSLHDDEIGREKFEAARFFETGVAEASYPFSVYGLNMNQIYQDYINRTRREKRNINSD